MKLEKYVDKESKRRKIILISISLIVLVCVSFLLYKTFASFTENVEFQMMKGKVDYFGNSDIYFVFYKQGELVEEMPLKDNADNIGFDHAECDNEASIIWNEEEWAPLVKNLKYVKTKCSLYFEKTKYYVSTNGNDEANGIKTTLNISGGTFENNKANYGGGLYLLSEKEGESTNKITNATIKGNNAISGGGIYIQSDVQNATYEIDGATIDGNVATKPENADGGVGGGIRFNGKDTTHIITLANVNIINNQSYNGGGIYLTGKLIFNSDKVDKNQSQTSGGGIMFSNKCEYEMNGGTISNNNATSNGGGIEIITNGQNGSVFNFNGGDISNNIAGIYGGGLLYNPNSGESTLNLKGTNFIGNTAETYGGGVYIDTKNLLHFELSAGTISDNTATKNTGGGIFLHSSGENNVFNITGGKITKNKTPSSSGGGLRYYLRASNNTLNISNVIISENTAKNNGGGINIGADGGLTNNIVNLKSGEITNNTVTNYDGGGIFVENIKEFNMSGGSITNNTSTSGTGTGGIYVKSDVETYTKTGGTISDNVPSDVGGIATK